MPADTRGYAYMDRLMRFHLSPEGKTGLPASNITIVASCKVSGCRQSRRYAFIHGYVGAGLCDTVDPFSCSGGTRKIKSRCLIVWIRHPWSMQSELCGSLNCAKNCRLSRSNPHVNMLAGMLEVDDVFDAGSPCKFINKANGTLGNRP